MITVTFTDAEARRVLLLARRRRAGDSSGVWCGAMESADLQDIIDIVQEALDHHRHKPGYTP